MQANKKFSVYFMGSTDVILFGSRPCVERAFSLVSTIMIRLCEGEDSVIIKTLKITLNYRITLN